jgi:hypothetical protein
MGSSGLVRADFAGRWSQASGSFGLDAADLASRR